jgi:phosphoribosyl-ATP pyrophosphohydrolase
MGKLPVTDASKPLMVVSSQSTSKRPPMTCGVRTEFNELREAVLIKVENEAVNEVEAVTNDDEGQLIGERGLLEEVLDLLPVVVIAFSADPFNFADLASASGGLDVLEMNLRIFIEINN